VSANPAVSKREIKNSIDLGLAQIRATIGEEAAH
jgi:hypothetical protein